MIDTDTDSVEYYVNANRIARSNITGVDFLCWRRNQCVQFRESNKSTILPGKYPEGTVFCRRNNNNSSKMAVPFTYTVTYRRRWQT